MISLKKDALRKDEDVKFFFKFLTYQNLKLKTCQSSLGFVNV